MSAEAKRRSGTSADQDAAPAAAPKTVDSPFRRAWSSPLALWITIGSLAVVILAVLAVGTLLGGTAAWHAYQKRADDAARNAAVSAAKTTVSNFMSVSAKSVDRDLKRTLDGATGDFGREYKNGMTQTRTAIVQNKVNAKARVLWAGATTSKRKSATVLVAMDATVRNTNAPDGRRAHYRVQVTMAEQKGRWLVSKLQFI